MKLKNFTSVFLFVLTFFLISQNSFSQFLRSNTPCDELKIIEGGFSVACRNYNSSLSNPNSFTGGSYFDCATVTDDDAGVENVSVLLNKGTGATACTDLTNGQFSPAVNYLFSGIAGSIDLSTIVVGNLNNSAANFADIAILNKVITQLQVSSANSATDGSGSFGTGATTEVNAQATGTTQAIDASSIIERAMAILDCDGDGDLDAAAAVREVTPVEGLSINILKNLGAGLIDVGSNNFMTGLTGSAIQGPLAIGDFNNDGIPDVVATSRFGNTNGISVCINNGSCNLTCTDSTFQGHTSTPQPTSIAAGDFNGDGNTDVAINEPATGDITAGIHYYFGNGLGGFSSTQHEAITDSGSTPQVLTTGCFNSDNIMDLAVSVNGDNESDDTESGVDVFELDTANVATLVHLKLFGLFLSAVDVGGVDAADFDRGGRDDIIVTGRSISGTVERRAYVFMNSIGPGLPTPVAVIPNQNLIVQTRAPLQLSGICQMSDGSVSDFRYQWSITSANAANASLTNATTLTPTFTATEFGNYTVQLTCTSACGNSSSATVVVVGIPATDQGGCISNSLSPISGPMNFAGLLPLLGPAGIWLLKKRKKVNLKKLFSFFLLFVALGVLTKKAEAATSFQTNFFKPAIDDSEYFTVYSSPLMKKGYYHTGFYLDFAQHPYEFGTSQFDRTNGITNHLLTGNFLGSYAIFDWLNAGARVPVYFWNGIRAPLLNRPNENRLDLGDVAIELKFKLVDRKDHKVGWSLLPFFTIPTATHAVRDFTGNGTLTGGVKTMLDGKPHDRVSIALNVGYEARDNVITPGGNRIDDHFLLGFGISGDAIKDKLKVIAETQVETVTKDFFSTRRTTPGEGRLGFRYMFKNGIDLNGGGGLGYTNGIASPDFRVFAGVTYTKRPIAKVAIKEDVGEVAVGDELKLADKIYFDFDKSTIRGMSKPTIDKAAAFIKSHPEIKKLRVEGNTCDLGTVPYNQKLSERRANAVVEYLVEQGVSRSILHPVGYGESRPAVPNTDESHREQNRRVQFFVEEK